MPELPLDLNYRPISPALYDPVGKQFAAGMAGPAFTASDGTPYAPSVMTGVIGTPVTASNTVAAAAANSAQLSGISGKTTYITGFTCTSGAPTSTVSGIVTVTGVIGGTLSYEFTESSTQGGNLSISFPIALPASAPDTAIQVNIPAITGGAATAVSVYGYQL